MSWAASQVTSTAVGSGPDTIVVNAYATLAAGVGAHFNLVVDGQTVGSAVVGTALQGYSFHTALAAGQAHDIEIVYDNDAVINGQDRNLLLQSITVDGQLVKATDSREVYRPSGLALMPSDGSMNWNGTADFALPASFFPAPPPPPPPPPVSGSGPDTIVVNAYATLAGGVGAHFNLMVDGQTVGSAIVGTTLQGYSFNTTLAAGQAHDIEVVYDNDTFINGQDRNLLLQSITVDGQLVAATDSHEIYRPIGLAALPGNGNMNWNGTADFALPASFFPAPPPPPPPPPPPVSGGGPDTIVVNAYADLAAGVGAHFNLVVDGQTVGSAIVGTALEGYSFHTTLAAGQAHDIEIVYDNDAVINGQDRNLLLQSITVDGQLVAATDSHEIYRPIGLAALPGNGNMYWDGTADFSLPSSYFPVTAPTPTPSGAAYYVSPNGSDSGDGSVAHPFATLARAQTAMESGSTHKTYVEGGTYSLSSALTLTSADSGTSFDAYPGQAAVLDGTAAGLSTLIAINGAKGVTLNGLTFANTGSGGAALELQGAGGNSIVANHFTNTGEAILLAAGSSGNTVSGNEIDNSATSAVEVIDSSNNNVFDSNLINGTGAIGTAGGGFFLHGVNDNAITHNLIENTAGMGIGISNWDSSTINVGNTIDYNIVRNTDLQSTDSGAIYLLGRSHVNTQATIADNLVDGTGSTQQHSVGIYLDDSTSGVNVTGNIVRNIGSDGAQIHGGDDVDLHNNIFDLGSGSPSAVLFQAAPADTNPTNTMLNDVVTQNVIYSMSMAPKLFPYIQGGQPQISNNLYFNTTGASMQTYAPTQDTSPVFGDPKFADPASGNYALQTGSAAAAIGFQAIDQSAIGLQPATAHWYVMP